MNKKEYDHQYYLDNKEKILEYTKHYRQEHKRGMINYDYEGSAMCDLSDKYCLVEYGNECETYNDYLKEEDRDA